MKARYFVGIAIILLGVVIIGLRHNNVATYNMLMYIVERDARGQDVSDEVDELREFVFTHMVTDGPVEFTLEGAYNKALAQAQAEAEASIDSGIYEQAAAACDREGQLTTDNARCVQEYVERRLTESGNEVPEVDVEAFSYTFESPAWAPDLPGLSLLGAALAFLVAAIVYIRYWWRRIRGSGKPNGPTALAS